MVTKRRPPLPKLRKDGQPKRSGRPPKDPTQEVVSRRDKPMSFHKRPSTNQFLSMSGDDLDDLIGTPTIPVVKQTTVERPEPVDQPADDDWEDAGTFYSGVTVNYLCQAFNMAPITVKKKLAHCPIKFKSPGGLVKYDLPTAASYLVKPRFDIATYIRGMKPQDLPPILQAAYWDAQKKRQDWELNAGDLWPTEKVVAVLADTFKLIKTSVMLFSDSLEQEHGLNEAQRATLTSMADGLMDEVHNSLVRQQEMSRTPNQKATLLEMEASNASSTIEIEDDDEQI